VSDPARILVLGVTGMLGHVVADELAPRFDVHGGVRDVERARRLGVVGTLHAFDAFEPQTASALIEELRPAVVVNAVGLVKQLEEASRPSSAIALNALLPHRLAEASAAGGARLIHVSTDCVFSGDLPAPAAYTEDDTPDARDLYGLSKLLGEVDAAPALTLRTSIIGPELDRASGLLAWFASQDGGAVNGFTNAIFSGLTTRALARVIERVVVEAPALSGLYHVSAQPISKFDLLIALRDALGMTCEVRPVDEPVINRALDSTRFREATGIAIPSWTAMIDEYRQGEPR
jgi:dTDP-4-dehydrorhamnose reductase